MSEKSPIYVRDAEQIKANYRDKQSKIFRRIHRETDGYLAASLACFGISFFIPANEYADIPSICVAFSAITGVVPALYWGRGIFEAAILERKCKREIRRVKNS